MEHVTVAIVCCDTKAVWKEQSEIGMHHSWSWENLSRKANGLTIRINFKKRPLKININLMTLVLLWSNMQHALYMLKSSNKLDNKIDDTCNNEDTLMILREGLLSTVNESKRDILDSNSTQKISICLVQKRRFNNEVQIC